MTRCASPPLSGRRHTWELPERVDRKYSVRLSGDQRGLESFALTSVRRRGIRGRAIGIRERPRDRPRLVVDGLLNRDGGRDAQALGVQLLALTQTDHEHPPVAVRPQEGVLSKPRSHVPRAGQIAVRRVELLALHQPDDLKIGVDGLERLSGDLDVHGRRV